MWAYAAGKFRTPHEVHFIVAVFYAKHEVDIDIEGYESFSRFA